MDPNPGLSLKIVLRNAVRFDTSRMVLSIMTCPWFKDQTLESSKGPSISKITPLLDLFISPVEGPILVFRPELIGYDLISFIPNFAVGTPES